MRKRQRTIRQFLIAYLALCYIFSNAVLLAGGKNVYAEEGDDEKGYWELTGSASHCEIDAYITNDWEDFHKIVGEEEVEITVRHQLDSHYEDGEYSLTGTILTDLIGNFDECGTLNIPAGSSYTHSGSTTELPERIEQDEEVSITCTLSDAVYNPFYKEIEDPPIRFSAEAMYGEIDWSNVETAFDNVIKKDSKENREALTNCWGVSRRESFLCSDSNEATNTGDVLSLVIGAGEKENDKMTIVIAFYESSLDVAHVINSYEYKWVGPAEVAAPIEPSTNDNDEENPTEKKTTEAAVVPAEPVDETVDTVAKYDPGDDGGDTVNPLIVFGGSVIAAGVGAGVAGAGGASGGNTKVKGDGSHFKLHIYKDFGDSLRAGGKTKAIYAYVERIKEGVSTIDIGLTQSLQVSSPNPGINVSVAGIEQNMLRINLSADKSYTGSSFTVTVLFMGEGGTFTKNVEFKIAPPASIETLDENRRYFFPEFNMLASQQRIVTFYVRLVNFMEQVDRFEITAQKSEDSNLIGLRSTLVEKDYYKLEVANRQAIELPQMGKYPLCKEFELRAYNQYGDDAKTEIIMQFYPEGIFIDVSYTETETYNSTQYAVIHTDEGTVSVNGFRSNEEGVEVGCAYLKDNDVEIVYDGISIDNFRTQDQLSYDIFNNTERFKLWIYGGSGDDALNQYLQQSKKGRISFQSNKALLMKTADVRYEYILDLSYNSYKAQLPFRLLGEVQFEDNKSLTREELVRRTKKVIKIMELSELYSVQELSAHLDSMPKGVIRQYARALYKEGLIYQNFKGNEYKSWATYMNDCVGYCNKTVWFCDITMSVIITIWTGGYSWIAEPAIMAFKELVFDNIIPDVAHSFTWDIPYKFDVDKLLSTVDSKTENIAANFLTGGSDMTLTKGKIVTVLVAAGLMKAGKNTKKNWDSYSGWDLCWKILKDTASEMTMSSIKTFIGYKITKRLGINSGNSYTESQAIKTRVFNSQEKLNKLISELNNVSKKLNAGNLSNTKMNKLSHAFSIKSSSVDIWNAEHIKLIEEAANANSVFIDQVLQEKIIGTSVSFAADLLENKNLSDMCIDVSDDSGNNIGTITLRAYIWQLLVKLSVDSFMSIYNMLIPESSTKLDVDFEDLETDREKMHLTFETYQLAAKEARYREVGRGLWDVEGLTSLQDWISGSN
ncbi:hypothetical protein SAMN02910369_00408 [Lachnospiraceae bacterium NE2001]|nr:hypothetical protein SAMN02910369_00408 [Lachnospiraceae bacterium NE2001]